MYASFEIQKEFIVSEICIEKDKKVNTCQGRCHLNKVLDEINNESSDKDRSSNIQFEELEESILLNSWKPLFKFRHQKTKFPMENIREISAFSVPPHHPPQV